MVVSKAVSKIIHALRGLSQALEVPVAMHRRANTKGCVKAVGLQHSISRRMSLSIIVCVLSLLVELEHRS